MPSPERELPDRVLAREAAVRLPRLLERMRQRAERAWVRVRVRVGVGVRVRVSACANKPSAPRKSECRAKKAVPGLGSG